MNDANPVEQITVLRTLGPVLAKTWRADGTIADYDDAKNYTVTQVSVADVHDLANLLLDLYRDPRKCIIRGKPRAGVDLSRPITRTLSNFEDQPSRLFMVDSDKFTPMLTDTPWASREDLQCALTEYLSTLPAEFRATSYVWQASGSFGHPSKGSTLRGHLWFWLDQPLTCAEAEEWAKIVLPGLADHTVHRCVQANYTARALMDVGVSRTVAVDAEVIICDNVLGDELVLPEITDAQRQAMERSRAGKKARNELVDPREKGGLVGALCRAYSPEEIVDLLPDSFTSGSDPTRITWVHGGGAAEGVGVSDSGTHLFNTHSTSPCGERALNLYDFIRVHEFGSLDGDADYSLDPASAPSEKAMREWVAALPGVQEELEAWQEAHPLSEAEREEIAEKKAEEEYANWKEALAECDSPRQVEGKYVAQMVRLRLTAFEEERARKLLKEKLGALGATVSDKALNTAIKDAKAKLAEQRRSQLVDVEVALARRVLVEHFGGVEGPHLKRFGSGWWMYIGGLWRPTEQDLIENRVASTIVRVKERGDADVKELAAFMAEQGRGDYLGALVSAVASHLKRLCGGEDAIADPLDLMGKNLGSVINCRNGELWFNSDGEVRFLDHNPAHNLTSQIACDYDPSAACPVFEAALARVFSLAREPQEMIRHWLELMGTIVQPTRLEAFWVMMKGPGGNGKSFLVEIIESLMGLGSCYKGSIAEIEKGSNVHFTASLVGKLMFFDDDVKKGVPLPDDWLKKLSEEKVLTANPKNKNTFEFVNRAVAVMLCNHWPHTSDVSHGMIRRAHVIETNFIIPKEQIRVGEQKYIIDNELPGVLNLLISGWRRVLRRGGFARPAEVVESVARWIDKANLTQRFIGSVLVKSDKAGVKTSVAQAYQEYKQWIELNEGPGCRPVGRRSFDEALESAGIEISVQHNQKVLRGYFLATLAGLSAEDAFGDVESEKAHDNAFG